MSDRTLLAIPCLGLTVLGLAVALYVQASLREDMDKVHSADSEWVSAYVVCVKAWAHTNGMYDALGQPQKPDPCKPPPWLEGSPQ